MAKNRISTTIISRIIEYFRQPKKNNFIGENLLASDI